MIKKRPHVALLIEVSNSYARGLLRGIRQFVREHQSWSIYLPEQGRGMPNPEWIANWQGDGILARIENRQIAQAVLAAGWPTVNLSAARMARHLPRFETDNRAIAASAFEHLRNRGFRNFGYCGDDGFFWSQERCKKFVELAREADASCSIYQTKDAGSRSSKEKWRTDLAQWLLALPKPAGVMACYDTRGWQVLEVCRRVEIRVPEEVGVIGVDNDELLCDLSEPGLSSVIPDSVGAGYLAASLLDAMMRGEPTPPDERLLAPLGIVARRSTDALIIDDDQISLAMRLIRDHACDGINVEHIVSKLAISRRAFETRFKKQVGHTPHEEISRIQMERVTQLLLETNLPLTAIADRAGFRHVEYLSAAFKLRTGQSPSEFRRAKHL